MASLEIRFSIIFLLFARRRPTVQVDYNARENGIPGDVWPHICVGGEASDPRAPLCATTRRGLSLTTTTTRALAAGARRQTPSLVLVVGSFAEIGVTVGGA